MIRLALLLLLLAWPAWGQGTSGTKITPGSVWTYLGPTYGASWVFGQSFYPGSPVDPIQFGADPTGVADSAPAIRQAIASSSNIVFSPGTYNLCSTQPSPYPGAINETTILVQNKSDFVINFGVAKLRVCDAVVKPSNGVETFVFDKVTNYTVIGGNFIGNMPTSASVGLTAAICTMNAVRPAYISQVFTGDWSSTSGGSGYCGDFIVNGLFQGATGLVPMTVGFDLAFLKDVSLLGFSFAGAHAGAPGHAGVSIVYDVPMVGNNSTGITIDDSSNVTIEGSASGFGAGWLVTAGSGYRIAGNYTNNTGAGAQSGWGGIIGYNASGVGSSVGHPPTNMLISGRYDGNGKADPQTGGGILIMSGNITNADEIAGIKVDAAFYNNGIVGISATSTSHMRDIQVSADCRGAAQTQCIGANVLAVSDPTITVSSAAPVPMASGVTATIASLSLPPGKWAVSGQFGITSGSGMTITEYHAAITPFSTLTFPCCLGQAGYVVEAPGAMSFYVKQGSLGYMVFNFAVDTTIYIIAETTYTGTGAAISGVGSLQATRI